MADFVKYRIPGETVVEKKGNFEVLKDSKNTSGFIVSDFLLKRVYSLKEDPSSEKEFSFSTIEPTVIGKDDYLKSASEFLRSLVDLKLKKAVYSRIKKVEFNQNKAEVLFEQLASTYPNAFVYLVSAKEFGTWLGASPEILLEMNERKATTMSLAGTKPAFDESEWTQKEIDEQRFVTDFILDKLKKEQLDSVEAGTTYISNAGPVKHLRTDIHFKTNSYSPFELAMILHPTPAVSGLPQKEAIDLILKSEKHDRLLYTGIIGDIGVAKSNLFVNLRSCQIQKDFAYLYLGGGFTMDSVPEKEWEETENKSKTLLNILQKQ